MKYDKISTLKIQHQVVRVLYQVPIFYNQDTLVLYQLLYFYIKTFVFYIWSLCIFLCQVYCVLHQVLFVFINQVSRVFYIKKGEDIF